MKLFTFLFLFCGFFLVQGCDSQSPPKSKIEKPLEGHSKALEKAKDLQRQLDEAAENQRKAIESMSQ